MPIIQLKGCEKRLYKEWLIYLEKKYNKFPTFLERTIAYSNAIENRKPTY